jgi:soluble lytic murein transglycosylase-like protein
MNRKIFVCLSILLHGIFLFPVVYGKEAEILLNVQPLRVPGAFFRSAMSSLGELIIPLHLRPSTTSAELDVADPVKETERPDFAYSHIVLPLAKKHGVDWRLVAAVIQAESGFNPRAVSSKGAIGLMQVMPNTAAIYKVKARELYNPAKNVEAGVQHLRMLADKYQGDLEKVIAAYNSGQGKVDLYQGIPPYRQTRNFVRRVLSNYHTR